ncbi:GNAT family N-acetyltransferase [Candidatus Pacearchaeota archaeon]|nr:GNAT family N-acetyltransferase [Candidatus Pacearchaeota archaeon]
MKIRKGEIKDFKKLSWGWPNSKKLLKKYIKGIKEKKQDFLVVEEGKLLIGEIHFFWENEDKQKADTKKRVYLCAFRIHKKFQGRGIGTKLINDAFEYIKKKGFNEVTIGSYKEEKRTQRYYKKLGFNKKVKIDLDNSGKIPKEFILFLKKL